MPDIGLLGSIQSCQIDDVLRDEAIDSASPRVQGGKKSAKYETFFMNNDREW